MSASAMSRIWPVVRSIKPQKIDASRKLVLHWQDDNGLSGAAPFTITINAPPGTYKFRCTLHDGDPQNMTGTITVTQ